MGSYVYLFILFFLTCWLSKKTIKQKHKAPLGSSVWIVCMYLAYLGLFARLTCLGSLGLSAQFVSLLVQLGVTLLV